MKKVLVVVVAIAVGFAFTSCKKNCNCSGSYKVDVAGMPTQEYTLASTSIGQMSKTECESYKYDPQVTVPGATVTADIKCKSE